MARTKKLTDYTYSPTNPASEDAIRAQIDDAIQEVYDASAKNADTVNLTGNQTIADVKTFSSSPIIPAPTTDLQASTKKYVDDGLLANQQGNHLGTWQGYSPVQTNPGIQSIVNDHTTKLNSLDLYKKVSYLDQYISGFYGRGQLLSEKATENLVTEQNLTASALAGIETIQLTETTKFQAGGIAIIKYDDGTYYPHFIRVKNVNSLSLIPPLIKNVTTNTKIERCWFNSAHPGKFYMRYLAQRLATDTENQSGFGQRIFYANFDTDSKDNELIAIGGAVVGTKESLSKESTYDSILESAFGKVAYFQTAIVDEGVKLNTFSAKKGENVVIKFFAMSRASTNTTRISIKNSSGTVIKSINLTGSESTIMKPYVISLTIPYDSDRFYIDFVNKTASANLFIIDEVEVLRSVGENDFILPRQGVIIGFGDSWIAGDTISSPERESILTHLSELLPGATILNKGVGGNKVQDLLARFDTDVAPFTPNVVVVNVGTNDAYNPESVTFDPTAIDFFVGKLNELIVKITNINAKPVIIGCPALAEEDGSALNFLLNDRSRAYAKEFNKKRLENNYGYPTVKLLSQNRYGKLDYTATYLSGNNYKDVNITIGSESIIAKRISIMASAFDATTSANVLLKVYNGARNTLIATSNTKTIYKGAQIQPIEFEFSDFFTLSASTNYILAFEGTNLWTVNRGGAGTIKNYGKFAITGMKVFNTSPPSFVLNDWIGVLIIPPIGIQKVFLNNLPTRYSVNPVLTQFDSNSNINIYNDLKEVLISYRCDLGEEFDFTD